MSDNARMTIYAAAHDAGVYDRKSAAYQLGARQLAEWHRLCEERRQAKGKGRRSEQV